MRNSGTIYELVKLRPHDHMGWVFSGQTQLAHLAVPFLAEGAAIGESLMYIAEDPSFALLNDLLAAIPSDCLQVASIAEVYGPSGIVDPVLQRERFASTLASALAAGYSGIRVAADNTTLVTDDERLRAWIAWEMVADRFMSDNPVTGLCAFDRQKVDVDRLRHLATLHPLSSSEVPQPQFRMFSDSEGLCVKGDIDSQAIEEVMAALEVLPKSTNVVVDLTGATFFSSRVFTSLGRLARTGVAVTVRAATDVVHTIRDDLSDEDASLVSSLNFADP